MRSIVTSQFRKMLEKMPAKIQAEARDGFNRWKNEPRSVGWKPLGGMNADVWSVQIGSHYRAIGVVSKEHNAVAWMFVGSHEDYNNFIEIRRKMNNKAWFAGGGTAQRLAEMGPPSDMGGQDAAMPSQSNSPPGINKLIGARRAAQSGAGSSCKHKHK